MSIACVKPGRESAIFRERFVGVLVKATLRYALSGNPQQFRRPRCGLPG